MLLVKCNFGSNETNSVGSVSLWIQQRWPSDYFFTEHRKKISSLNLPPGHSLRATDTDWYPGIKKKKKKCCQLIFYRSAKCKLGRGEGQRPTIEMCLEWCFKIKFKEKVRLGGNGKKICIPEVEIVVWEVQKGEKSLKFLICFETVSKWVPCCTLSNM